MPDQSLNVTVSDPLSATVREVAGAVTAVMQFLSSPAGQLLVQQSIKDAAAFKEALAGAGEWFENLWEKK